MTNSEGREVLLTLFRETIPFIQPAPRMRELMKLDNGILSIGTDRYNLQSFDTVRILAFGKAANEMMDAAIAILRGVPMRGIVVSPREAREGSRPTQPGIRRFQAGHPYPDEQSVLAADAAIELLTGCAERDLVLFLISGGGSALLERPIDDSISPADLRAFYELLVTCGANIVEMNALRKHLSRVKGGRLARIAAGARQATIYVSDVPDDFPSAVASGPSMPDETTLADCRRIADRYGLMDRFPASIRAFFETGAIPETPKPGDACFAQSGYHCLLSNRTALERIIAASQSNGYAAAIDASCDDWSVDQAAEYLLAQLEVLRGAHPGTPVLLISGGELSSPVAPGSAGIGGRNQAFVLECVPRIATKRIVVLSAGTDGKDGNSPATGAIADGESARRAAAMGFDAAEYLRNSDSYQFFARLGDDIVTGPTGTNVRDLRLLLAYG